MEHFIIPENYQPALSLHDTQVGIKTVKDFFQKTSRIQQLILLYPCQNIPRDITSEQ